MASQCISDEVPGEWRSKVMHLAGLALMTMGRPMVDHTQLARASTSAGNGEDARIEALRLMKTKDDMEAELDALHSGLQSQGADFGVSLFDGEGFPRADIDVYNVRLQRVRIIELRNDLKGVSERIKSLLEIALARPPPSNTSTILHSGNEGPAATKVPFALCNGVAPSSPAAAAGMKRGDRIVRFGGINASNHDNLRAVASEVKEGRNITIDVLRENEAEVGLVLTPKTWSGRGLLGCHIVPIQS